MDVSGGEGTGAGEGEKLMVNVDAKTRTSLDEFQKRSIKQLDQGDDLILAQMKKLLAENKALKAAEDDKKQTESQ